MGSSVLILLERAKLEKEALFYFKPLLKKLLHYSLVTCPLNCNSHKGSLKVDKNYFTVVLLVRKESPVRNTGTKTEVMTAKCYLGRF